MHDTSLCEFTQQTQSFTWQEKERGDKMLRARTIFKSFTKRSRAFNVPLPFPWLTPYSTNPLLLMNVFLSYFENLYWSLLMRSVTTIFYQSIDWWFLVFVNFGLTVMILGRKKTDFWLILWCRSISLRLTVKRPKFGNGT